MTVVAKRISAAPPEVGPTKASKSQFDNVDWEDERNLAKLRALWNEGLSTAEIGRRMNASKNAIVGKAHRLNLGKRESPILRREDGYIPEPKQPKRIQPGESTLPQLSIPISPVPPREVPARPRYTAREQPCVWPIGEPGKPSFHFCNAGAVQGKPYCEDHAAIAYVRVKDRREDVA